MLIAMMFQVAPDTFTKFVNVSVPLFILVYLVDKGIGTWKWWISSRPGSDGNGNGYSNGNKALYKELEQIKSSYASLYTVVGTLQVSLATITSALERGVLPRLDDYVDRLRAVERRGL